MGESIKKDTGKRQNVATWDETFMKIAYVIAERSKDPKTQVGAVIVDENNIVLSLGYNGFPRGCSDDEFPWHRGKGSSAEPDAETKYMYVIHAECNALLMSTTSLQNSKIYVTLFPCNNCAKMIIQKGVKEVIYADEGEMSSASFIAAKRMFSAAGVCLRKFSLHGEAECL
eukprot:GCRY01002554.1.p1 GENE.GCRY01002554.1~~GCRY01002554.1.p1  ORF type:complete len:171 (-),score=19.11 GCRY01002554.1:263-775(-)